MQRVLKFRAWDTKTGYWVEGLDFVIHTSGRILNIPEHIVLMQFTGLQDKHGREVYEGDIYRNLDNGRIGKFYELNGPGGYTLHCRENNADGSPYNMLPFAQLDTTNFEVIGNLYETPDLLPQQEKREER